MKKKFVNKYENYKKRVGTICKENSKTNQSSAEDCDIYKCIEKYGIQALMRKTEATELFYDDLRNRPKTLDEAMRLQKNLTEYFKQQPAKVRKSFGDNPQEFYHKYRKGDFNNFIKQGILNDELAKCYLPEQKEEKINENTNTNDNFKENSSPSTNNN